MTKVRASGVTLKASPTLGVGGRLGDDIGVAVSNIAKAIDRLKKEGCVADLPYSSASYYDVAEQICRLAGLQFAKYLRSKTRQKNLVCRFVSGGVSIHKKDKDSFYATREWKDLRYAALVRHGGRCQCCGESSATGSVLHVDHIKPKSLHPQLALTLDNLQVLCEACNVGKSNRDSTDWRPRLVVST